MLDISVTKTKVNGIPKGRPNPVIRSRKHGTMVNPFKINIENRLRGLSSTYSKIWRMSTGDTPMTNFKHRDLV